MLHPEPDLVIAGKYRLVRRLGVGGMASVWLAKHLQLDSEVAVKLMGAHLDPTVQARARFEREAKASALLRSAHITRVVDYGVEADTPFMVQELLLGEDLGQRMARPEPLTLSELELIATQVCKGLRAAHEAGIVHRDIKPGNIFLAKEGPDLVVKVLDFGIAREMEVNLVHDHTSSGTLVGSPHHMSPEQALAEKVDHRSDLWSLGVVLYRGVTGKRPFESESLTALVFAIATKAVPPPSSVVVGLEPDLDRFFARALHRDPDRRFQSANEMAEAFKAAADGRLDEVMASTGAAPRETTMAEGVPAPAASPLPSQSVAAQTGELSEGTLDRPVATGVTVRARGKGIPRALSLAMLLALGMAVLAAGFFGVSRMGKQDPTVAASLGASPAADSAPLLASPPPAPSALATEPAVTPPAPAEVAVTSAMAAATSAASDANVPHMAHRIGSPPSRGAAPNSSGPAKAPPTATGARPTQVNEWGIPVD